MNFKDKSKPTREDKIKVARIKSGSYYSTLAERYAGNKFDEYKASAKRKNRVFELNKEEFFKIVLDKCSYCGNNPAMGVDRVDSNFGYTKENSVPSCKLCNYAKHCLSREDFILHIEKIYKYLIKL